MWTTFFSATSSASAALAGLIFVALSVNIRNIIGAAHLPSRTAAAIGTLVMILACSVAALIPESQAALGREVIGFAVLGGLLQFRSGRMGFALREQLGRPLWEPVLNAVLGVLQVLPMLIAGILLLVGNPAGLYWMAAGCVTVFVLSVLTAWVLLVEILR
jgi:hypothetical protein